MILPCFSINHIMKITLASLEFFLSNKKKRKENEGKEGKKNVKLTKARREKEQVEEQRETAPFA